MERKPNITLLNCGEFGRRNIGLGIRKGFNELLGYRKIVIGNRKKATEKRELALSFIICTTCQCQGLTSALESALSQTANTSDYEVIVVINGDGNADFPSRVKVIREVRKGISFARNCGAENAKGEILLYMDDDAIADKNLVKIIIETFDKYKDIGVTGGQICTVFPENSQDIVLSGKEGLWSNYTVPYKKFRQVKEQYELPYGACFAVRHQAFKDAGGFSTSYGRVGNNYAGGEETALCLKTQKMGWKTGVQPLAVVEHIIDEKRVTREHVKQTIRAGILTTYRLIRDGYLAYNWNERYIRERIRIAEKEMDGFLRRGEELELFYKQCERDAFAELLSEIITEK